MRGYKGIRYTNGILRAKVSFGKTGEIFEVGVPKQRVKIDGGMAFSENGYSFCGRIEDVLPWEDFCKPLEYRKASVDSRLFLVDTLGSEVVGNSKHYKAEQIVVLREITHNEIVQYFTEHPDLRASIKEEHWEKFCADKFEEYKLKISTDEINKALIENCSRLGQLGLCKQDSKDYMLSKCNYCDGKMWNGDVFYDLTDYYYLHARKKIYDGIALDKIEEYQHLKGCTVEQDNLRLLSEWLSKKRME